MALSRAERRQVARSGARRHWGVGVVRWHTEYTGAWGGRGGGVGVVHVARLFSHSSFFLFFFFAFFFLGIGKRKRMKK